MLKLNILNREFHSNIVCIFQDISIYIKDYILLGNDTSTREVQEGLPKLLEC